MERKKLLKRYYQLEKRTEFLRYLRDLTDEENYPKRMRILKLIRPNQRKLKILENLTQR